MTSSSRRKQDDKHLKILRDIVAQTSNRTCFDCKQKGPTYINMTIGSFICTSCSGILRGLNPPHRVKSISMATFTPDEISQIKSKGNQYCKSVWLGLYDEKSTLYTDISDEHKLRDFMIAKYERKRFYLDPAVAVKMSLKNDENSPKSSSSSETKSLPAATQKNDSSSVHTSLARPIPNMQPNVNTNGFHQSSRMKGSNSMDLLSNILTAPNPNKSNLSRSKTVDQSDPYKSPAEDQFKQYNQGFANFDNANIFSNSTISKFPSNPTLPTSSNPSNTFSSNPLLPLNPQPSNAPVLDQGGKASLADRYAALKDLDEAFKTQKDVSPAPVVPSAGSALFGIPPTSNQIPTAHSLFGTPPVVSSNGFNATSNSFSTANNGFNASINSFSTANNGFNAPSNSFSTANNGFNVPNSGFSNANNGFNAPNSGIINSNNGFNVPNSGFSNSNNGFNVPNSGFSNSNNGFNVPSSSFNAVNVFNNAVPTSNSSQWNASFHQPAANPFAGVASSNAWANTQNVHTVVSNPAKNQINPFATAPDFNNQFANFKTTPGTGVNGSNTGWASFSTGPVAPVNPVQHSLGTTPVQSTLTSTSIQSSLGSNPVQSSLASTLVNTNPWGSNVISGNPFNGPKLEANTVNSSFNPFL